MEFLALVSIFLIFSAWREWIFHKSLKEMEQQRQQPIKDISQKMLARDLTDLKFKGTPNNIAENDPNVFDLDEGMSMHIPKDFNMEIEDSTGETITKGKFTNQ